MNKKKISSKYQQFLNTPLLVNYKAELNLIKKFLNGYVKIGLGSGGGQAVKLIKKKRSNFILRISQIMTNKINLTNWIDYQSFKFPTTNNF